MTLKYKTKAFVFRKNNINESDRVFSVFSDDFGRLDIFAKAIRKNASKLRSGIDIFFMSEIEFIQGRNKKTLTDAVVIDKFNNLYQDLEKFKIASRIGEILDNFIKGEEKDEDIFNLINEIFYKLNDQDLKIKKDALIYYYFLWNALSLLGYHLEVQKCASCHEKLNPYNIYNFCPTGQPVASQQASGGNYINPAISLRSLEATFNLRETAQESQSDGDFYFSSKEGGIICGNCANIKKTEGPEPCRRINSDIVKILRIILSKDWQTMSKLKIEPYSKRLLEDISENVIHTFCPS